MTSRHGAQNVRGAHLHDTVLRCGIHFMVRYTLYGAVYTLWCGIHFMVRYTLYGAVYTLWFQNT